MSTPQPGILGAMPNFSRYLEFRAVPDRDIASVLRELTARPIDDDLVVGIGPGLVQGLGSGLGQSITGLRPFPSLSGPGCEIPSTQTDIWCWIRG